MFSFYLIKNLYIFDVLILVALITLLLYPISKFSADMRLSLRLFTIYLFTGVSGYLLFLHIFTSNKLGTELEYQFNDTTRQMFSLHRAGDKDSSLAKARLLLQISDQHLAELDIKRIESIHHVGWLLWDQKRYREASDLLEQSLILYKRKDQTEWFLPQYLRKLPPGVHGSGNEHYILADIYSNLGDFELADYHYQQALACFKFLPWHKWYYHAIQQSYDNFLSENKERSF